MMLEIKSRELLPVLKYICNPNLGTHELLLDENRAIFGVDLNWEFRFFDALILRSQQEKPEMNVMILEKH
jgi:hypothetical protein